MRINPPSRILSAALCCIFCWGCGPAGHGTKPELIPVKGKVIYKGKPLSPGKIKFIPDGYGREASGDIQPDGSYVLTTHKEGDGVVPGEHRVTIISSDKSLARDRALEKYGRTSTSRLTAEVDKDHTEFPFDLK